jgi:hypothetical protein
VANTGWYKEVTRGLIDRVKHSQVSYPLIVQKLDKPPPRTPELVL